MRMHHHLALGLLFASTLALAQDEAGLWGENRGCMQGVFTRSAQLAERARAIEPMDQNQAFSLSFRFKTVDKGSYAGLAFIGVRKHGAPFKVNAAGVAIFRHSDTYGLVGNVFVAGSDGVYYESKKEMVSLEYGRTYDVACTYSPGDREVMATFTDVLTGQAAGVDIASTPEAAQWTADTLACWNCADGHSENAQLALFIDNLTLNEEPQLTFAHDLKELPIGEDERFSWYQAPEPPLISKLTAPEDVFGEDEAFTASVCAGTTGTVRFALLTYDGREMWSREAPIAAGKATALVPGAEAKAMEKGSCVLAATVNERHDQTACRALRLRGRIHRDTATEPPGIEPGDEVIITDLSPLTPEDAIADESTKAKWWRRTYSLPGGEGEFAMACVEEQDLDDPESCIAPPITLPLDLHGWYEIWVRTYRHRENGGIDVRLSGEPYFFHADPMQVDQSDGAPDLPAGRLVDIRYRAADLTGQDLVFQQPYGTYDSANKLCNAALAGVRLVKLSDAQVERLQSSRAREDTKVIAFDNDGFSYFYRWATHDTACIGRLLEPLRDTSAAFLNYELGGLGGLFIPTPYTGMYQMTGHTRHGDYRANAFFKWCFENDVNIADILAERAHEVGLKFFVSLMMERSFSVDRTMKEHPGWMIQRGRGRWDYANPEVQDYQVEKIAWIMKNHAIDGFIVDYTRYGYYFNEDEPNKFEHMNTFLRKLRRATDEVNAEKERKVLLCGSFGDRSWHLTHWGTGTLEDQGLDVKTWLEEGIFDMLMPEGPAALDFVAMAKDSRTALWPRFVSGVSIKEHQGRGGREGPKALERGVKWAFDRGAPGIFFFNHDTWSTMGRLGFRQELGLRVKTQEVYGLREGPLVEFAAWYPDLEQRAAQRAAINPLAVPIDTDAKAACTCVLPIRNTFPEEVDAAAAWTPAEPGSEAWRVEPSTASAHIAPGQTATLIFEVAGSGPSQEAMPSVQIEMAHGGQTIFRHRTPVRAVSHAICRKASAPPNAIAADARPFFSTGGEGDGQRGVKAQMTATYDDEALYILVGCSGVDAAAIPRKAEARDARDMAQNDHIALLVDVAGSEQTFCEFVATPAGGQADVRHNYDAFLGHFRRDTKWNAEWTAQTEWHDHAYTILFRLPFESLGAKPQPGASWRFGAIVHAVAGCESPQTRSWACPGPGQRTATHLGALAFE